MGKIYAKRIIAGPRTLDDVPANWKQATIDALKELLSEEEFNALMGIETEEETEEEVA